MNIQIPDLTFIPAHSGLHDCARITANRLPNESVAAWVREADAECKELYEMRENLLKALRRTDLDYNRSWDAAYERVAGTTQGL